MLKYQTNGKMYQKKKSRAQKKIRRGNSKEAHSTSEIRDQPVIAKSRMKEKPFYGTYKLLLFK